jgi:hypothetical protein
MKPRTETEGEFAPLLQNDDWEEIHNKYQYLQLTKKNICLIQL